MAEADSTATSSKESSRHRIEALIKSGEGIDINHDEKKLEELKRERKRLRSEMKSAAAEVRNERRKKSRLLNKAKHLPTNDLLEIARMRFLATDSKAAKAAGTETKTSEDSEDHREG